MLIFPLLVNNASIDCALMLVCDVVVWDFANILRHQSIDNEKAVECLLNGSFL